MSQSMACQAFDPACLQPSHLSAWLPYLLGPCSPCEYSGFLLMSSSYVKLRLVYFTQNSGSIYVELNHLKCYVVAHMIFPLHPSVIAQAV